MSDDPLISIPLHRMIPKPNITAGMNPLVIMAVAHTLRTGNDVGWGVCRTAPIHVRPHPQTPDLYVIMEGRHRWLAHWIAGLPTAECIIEG